MEKAILAASRTLITDSQTPLSTGSIHAHQPIQRVVFWAETGASPGTGEGVSGRSLCRKGFTPVKMTPRFPRKIHWRTEVSRDSLSHHELWAPGGDGATKAEGAVLQVRRAPLGTRVPASSANLARREAGICPSTTPLLLQMAQGKPGARQNGAQVWDVLWSSCHLPLLPPCSGQGRSSCAPAPTLHTKHTKGVTSQQSLITRWDKASPGESRSHLTSFKGEKCTPHHGWTWPEEHTDSMIHPTKPTTDSLSHKHQRPAHPPVKVQRESASKRHQPC